MDAKGLRRIRRWRLLALLAFAVLLAGAAEAAAPADLTTLKLASWNLEWLIAPAAFKPLKQSCAPEGTSIVGDVRQLPCDVAHRLERSSRDFAALARYARMLDADVIALQEVDGSDAARLVFPDYDFCFTGRRHVQNNGFAVRAGIPHRCAPDLMSLSRGDSLRRGAELVLFPGEPREIRLLSVHLKSGCSAKPLDGGDKACSVLARQAPALQSWIDRQAGAGQPFGVLGDFNRDFLADRQNTHSAAGQLLHLWPGVEGGSPPGARLHDAAAGQPFRNCAPGQGYAAYIDHLVFSASLAANLVPKSFQRVSYSAADARRARLSDHCPIAVRVRIEQIVSTHPRLSAPTSW